MKFIEQTETKRSETESETETETKTKRKTTKIRQTGARAEEGAPQLSLPSLRN